MKTIRKAVTRWFPEIRDVSHIDSKYSNSLYHIVAQFFGGSKRSLKNKSGKAGRYPKRIYHLSRPNKWKTISRRSKNFESFTLAEVCKYANTK